MGEIPVVRQRGRLYFNTADLPKIREALAQPARRNARNHAA